MITKKLLTIEATPGVTVAEDVFSSNDQLVVAKDTVLTSRIIARLKFYSIHDITVFAEEPTVSLETMQIPQKEQQSYFEKVRETIAFKQFNRVYLESVKNVKESLNSIVTKNEPIEEDKMLSYIEKILDKSRNGLHILEMLHCMRDYDDYTFVHSVNVSLICHIMGEWLHLSKRDIRVLTLAGLFHDIGKLVVPQDVIGKPARLTPTEFSLVKTHTIHGFNILNNEKIDTRIKLAALQHHERCDGSGYPGGCLTNEIEPFSKIVAIADVYDAMTSDRVYRPKICPFNVIHLFEEEGMRKYDPRYLMPFLERTVESYVHNSVKLSNDEYGEVVFINKFSLSKPLVKLDNRFIDLSKEHHITIEGVL